MQIVRNCDNRLLARVTYTQCWTDEAYMSGSVCVRVCVRIPKEVAEFIDYDFTAIPLRLPGFLAQMQKKKDKNHTNSDSRRRKKNTRSVRHKNNKFTTRGIGFLLAKKKYFPLSRHFLGRRAIFISPT